MPNPVQSTIGSERLGVDIGRVLTPEVTDDTYYPSLFNADDYLQTPTNMGAIETLREAREARFGEEIYLVSKCGPEMQTRTSKWLTHVDFFERTGIPSANLYFCLTRSEKGIIAARLALTHFIDDRQDVLQAMPPTVQQRILYAPDGAPRSDKPNRELAKFTIVNNWGDIRKTLMETSRAA